MRLISKLLTATAFTLCLTTSLADVLDRNCCKDKVKNCCKEMGGISYCDSSVGRYVCNNGYYSSCYCTRHAVMDLQKIEGCCLWQGGVLDINPLGLVVCNNGGISEICSLQNPNEAIAAW